MESHTPLSNALTHMQLIIDTYEGPESVPVISHTFYGRSVEEIQAVIRAHMGTDTFFKAAMTTRNFQGIPLRNVKRWMT